MSYAMRLSTNLFSAFSFDIVSTCVFIIIIIIVYVYVRVYKCLFFSCKYVCCISSVCLDFIDNFFG